jgi:transposase
MGRPPSMVEDYREWQRRLERYQTSEAGRVLSAGRRFSVHLLSLEAATQQEHPRKATGGFRRAGAERFDRLAVPAHLVEKVPHRDRVAQRGHGAIACRRESRRADGHRPRGRFLAPLEGASVMIELSEIRVFLCTIPTKMNYSFDTLMGLAQQIFDEDPLSGHLFLFVNRQRDRLKILFWDHDGLAIFYKRLEAGTFQLPRSAAGEQGIELDERQLNRLLTGLDLRTGRRRRRYRRVG